MRDSSTKTVAHRRQFVISRKDTHPPICPKWLNVSLENDFYLHHCPELSVLKLETEYPENILLLGETDQFSPNLSIDSRSDLLSIILQTRDWSGRWALIIGDIIITDAAALMGVYYGTQQDPSVSQTPVISSSLTLMEKLFSLESRSSRALGWYGMNWFPAPLTPLNNIQKLLNDQFLNLTNLTVEHLPRLDPERYCKLSSNERSIKVADYLERALSNLAQKGQLEIALTAGLDSRVLLSVALKTGIPFSTYTLEHPLISKADREIPFTLAQRFDFKHKFIPLEKSSPANETAFAEHLAGYMEDSDKYFISRSMFSSFSSNTLLVRGGGFEVGRNFYYSKLHGLDLESLRAKPELLARKFHCYGSLQSTGEELRRWLDWRELHPTGYDWRDEFYLDQRLGTWLSTVENALDMIEARSFHPFSSAELIDLTLSYSERERSEATMWYSVIEINESKLLDVPINPSWDPASKKWRETISRYRDALFNEIRNFLR